MKRCGSGGIVLAQCSPLTSGESVCRRCASTPIGNGHLDEVYVKINGVQHYLWRAVDHERRSSGILRHQDAGQGRSLEIHQESAEATRPHKGRRNGSTALLWRRAEGDRRRRSSAHGPAAQQPSREQPPALSTTRTSDAEVSPDEDPAEIQRRPRLLPQPLQSGTSPRQPRRISKPPLRRLGRVAVPRRLKFKPPAYLRQVETSCR